MAENDDLRAALLGVKTITNQWGGPCWCRTVAGLYCVGQKQCEAARKALGIDHNGKPLKEPTRA